MPKNLYKVDLEGPSCEHEHSLYHSISLGRGQVHNVVIHSNDSGAVLTWDFDVMRHNVTFTVLHKPKVEDEEEKAGAKKSDASLSFEQEISDTKEWKDGKNCVKVEPSIICHDGESIQVPKQN